MLQRTALLLAAASLAAGPVVCQTYLPTENQGLGIKYLVHKKLESIPLELGREGPHLKVRYEPGGPGDYLHGRYGTYEWYLRVFEFPKRTPKAADANDSSTTSAAEAVKEAIEHELSAADYEEWVRDKDPGDNNRKFVQKGKKQKVKSKIPAVYWEYTDTVPSRSGAGDVVWWSAGCVYQLPDREIALQCTLPVRKGTRPDKKNIRWAQMMIFSLVLMEVEEDDGPDKNRDKYANTPERRKELDRVKANIVDVPGWDYFTMPNYIVFYSWDADRKTKQRDSYKFTLDLVQELELVRELYVKAFPPHDDMLNSYSVLRVCNSREEFHKYGTASGGTAGWFNPQSKELVVFRDRDGLLKGYASIEEIAFHEGWHQYADSYYGNDIELHRWYDEGLGEFFGSHKRKGRGWKYEVLKGRMRSIKSQMSRDTFIPNRELVTWDRSKFYGSPRSSDHYAQAYSIIDFLQRGPDKLGKRFKPEWKEILDTYRTTILKTKSQKKAVEKAFENVDWDEFDAMWLDWVKKRMK